MFGWKLTGHPDGHDAFRKPHAPVFGEFFTRQDLAARDPGEVGDEAFDLSHMAIVEPLFEVAEGEAAVMSHHGSPLLSYVDREDAPACGERKRRTNLSIRGRLATPVVVVLARRAEGLEQLGRDGIA